MKFFPFLILTALVVQASGNLRDDLEPFLDEHCYACHDDLDEEGDLNLLDLKFDPSSEENQEIWQKVFHRVEEGEMPPKKEERPVAADLTKFLHDLEAPLSKIDAADLKKRGRVSGRRLTREEYQYTLYDLLGIDILLGDFLTPESTEGFDNEVETQQLSLFHLESYLQAADAALEEAFQRAVNGEIRFAKNYSAYELTYGGRRRGYRGPEFRDGKVISWNGSIKFYGRMYGSSVPADGWYKVTVQDVEAINAGEDGSIWGNLQSGVGNSSAGELFQVGLIEAREKPKDFTFTTWIREGHVLLIKPSESKIPGVKLGRGGVVRYRRRDLEKEGHAGIRFSGIRIERVYPQATQKEVREKLFSGLDPKDFRSGGEEPQKELRRLIKNFANRAWRRPVDLSELRNYARISIKRFAETGDFSLALRTAYHAILCSPHFLTLIEGSGQLNDHELATRLSYLLWKSLPDAHLRQLADEGKLREPKRLHAEMSRLLAHAKGERFVKSFTDQWLDLRKIDFTQPDRRRFQEFDSTLQQSMVAETRQFFAELVRKDLSVTHFLKSDFAFLNTRLQEYYGYDVPAIPSDRGLRKVKLGSEDRSGLLTQGSILKVTADGSVTSPIIRGVWVNERILGRHIPPPPPDIPSVEPDIRGAVSIRDQLAKHSTATSCKSCHAKIDPSGFALESFDPIGKFRQSYGRRKTSAKVDPSGVTPKGESFQDFGEWREIYLAQPELLARSFADQILRYGTGGEIRFSDRRVLDKIVSYSAQNKYGLRSLIYACITSPIFQKK